MPAGAPAPSKNPPPRPTHGKAYGDWKSGTAGGGRGGARQQKGSTEEPWDYEKVRRAYVDRRATELREQGMALSDAVRVARREVGLR